MESIGAPQTHFYQDTAHLKKLNEQDGLQAAAKQFEGLFFQMMMKSMRDASAAMESEDSPFSSDEQKTFMDMVDAQMAQDLAGRTNLGLTDAIVRQMTPHLNNGVKS